MEEIPADMMLLLTVSGHIISLYIYQAVMTDPHAEVQLIRFFPEPGGKQTNKKAAGFFHGPFRR